LSASIVSAGSEAKLGSRHEISPFMVLLIGSAIRVSENEASLRVSSGIVTVRVEFSSRVASRDTNLGKVSNASDLDIVGCLDEMGA